MKANLARYALVAALALAVAVAGSAGAAALITGKSIKDGSIGFKDLSRKARAKLKGARGATGPQGPQGPAGLNGAVGAPGSSASAAPSLQFGSVSLNDGSTFFLTPDGSSVVPEAAAQTPIPPGATLVARDWNLSSVDPPGVGDSYRVVLKVNNVETALGCNITGTNTSCQPPDPSATVTLEPGDRIHFLATETGAPGASRVSWSFKVVL